MILIQSERRITYNAILPSTIIDEKYIALNVNKNVIVLEKKCYVNSYSSKYEFQINPIFNKYTFTINTALNEIFKNRQVVEDKYINKLQVIQIPDNISPEELLIVYDNPLLKQYTAFNMSTRTFFNAFTTKISTNTYHILLYLILTQSPIYLKISLNAKNFEQEKNIIDYINYLEDHSYLTINLNGKYFDIDNMIKYKIYTFPPHIMIPLEINIYEYLLDIGNNNISIEWYYPFTTNKKGKISLNLKKFT